MAKGSAAPSDGGGEMALLLPRDFCDKQPARWKKDATRRGATRAIAKLERAHQSKVAATLRELANAPLLARDREARGRRAADRARESAADAPHAPAARSEGRPIPAASARVRAGRSFWAAELRLNAPLVLRLPEDATLRLTGAVLLPPAPAPAGECPAVVLRCRTPDQPAPVALCRLAAEPGGAAEGAAAGAETECAAMDVEFTGDGDRRLALAIEPAAATEHAAAAEAAAQLLAGARAHVSGVLTRGARCQLPRAPRAAARGQPAPAEAAAEQRRGRQPPPLAAAGAAAPDRAPAPDADAAAAAGGKLRTAPRAPQPSAAGGSGCSVLQLDDGLKLVDNRVGPAASRRVRAGDKLTVRFQGLVCVPRAPRARSKAGGGAQQQESAGDWMEFDRGTLSFALGAGEVVKGWDRGLVGMRVGGRRTLIVPPALGYGSRGAPPRSPAGGVGIPPYATLVFRCELLNAQ